MYGSTTVANKLSYINQMRAQKDKIGRNFRNVIETTTFIF